MNMICTIDLKELPFIQDSRQVIYTEGTYCEAVNNFIVRNHSWVKHLFEDKNYEFCYLPNLKKELMEPGIVNYFSPYHRSLCNAPDLGNDFILDFMLHPENKTKIKPMLLFHSHGTEVEYPGAAFQYQSYILDLPKDLHAMKPRQQSRLLKSLFHNAADAISCHISNSAPRIRFCKVDMVNDAPYDADMEFDRDSWQLIIEIRERIAKLHQKGISYEILRRTIKGNEKLSRLVVTRDYRIFLPDYNIEVSLRPLPKAVYLLFLRHPDGILFKKLPDYREELAELYLKFRGGELSEKEYQSVLDVTNPLNNSINEKCARIREAFLSKFDEHLAHYYYIDGHKGEPKRICLPDKLIEWE